MLVTRRYRYRLSPSKETQDLLNRTFGCCRKVYNVLLERAVEEYEAYKECVRLNVPCDPPNLSQVAFSAKLTLLKKEPEYAYLTKVSSVPLQQVTFDLAKAFSGLLKNKTGHPKFKSRFKHNAAEYTTRAFYLEDGKLYIGKVKSPIDVVWSRALPSVPKTATITKTPSGKYHVSFVVEVNVATGQGTEIVGIDLGIKTLAVCSDGKELANPRYYVSAQKKLARAQRRHARKHLKSKNREKSRLKLARLHEKVANQRLDYMQKFTTTVTSKANIVCLEDLNVVGMAANHKLAKHIMDASFGMLRQLFTYKLNATGTATLVIVDRYDPTTQKCSTCKTKSKEHVELHQRSWTCSSCGAVHYSRDLNAAYNIRDVVHYPKVAYQLSLPLEHPLKQRVLRADRPLY